MPDEQEQPRFVKPSRKKDARPPLNGPNAAPTASQSLPAHLPTFTSASGSSASDASPAEAQIAQLAQKLNIKLFVRKELKKLPSMLQEHEQVLNLAQGAYEGNQGLIVATDRRVMFVEEGFVRSRRQDFPYSKISSLHVSTGMLAGTLTIFASGSKAQLTDVMPKQQAHALGDYIRMRIDDAPVASSHLPGMTALPTPPEPAGRGGVTSDPEDVFEKLRKLSALRDAGVVTDAEFEAKKAELLARI